VRGAFVRWHESVTELRAMRSKSRLIVLRWKLKAVGDCMATWGDAVRQRRVARRCVSRMTQRRLAASFELFVEGIEGLARAEAEEARREARMATVLARIWNQSLNAAFVRWHESVAELRAMRSKSRLIVLRWKLKAVGDCMATWGDAVRQRRVARRCVSRMTQRRLAASFELWIERLEELARAEAEEERKKASAGRIVLHLVWACVCDVCMHALRVWG